MKEDPISKSQIGPGMGRRRIIAKNQGRGSIPLTKDYSRGFQSNRSKVAFVSFCAIPYIAGVVYLYFTALKVFSILMFAIPLVLGLVFWFVIKQTTQ